MYKDSRVYVAGDSGLLGNVLLRKLAEGHYENVITVGHGRLDLMDRQAVFDYFSQNRPEYVFFAAGNVGGIASDEAFPADYLHVNLAIQDNIFEAACEFEVKNVVFCGSSCTYPKELPPAYEGRSSAHRQDRTYETGICSR